MKEFDISQETMVVTSIDVTKRGMPVLYVSHEPDEEGGILWQFHSGSEDYSMEKMQLVRLDTILRLDPTLGQVADLPLGFSARRNTITSPWNYLKED